jgi:4-oxalocrotonate tautomerase
MPLVNVKLIDGVFSESQKKQMATKLTDAMVSIEGENMRPVTWVVIEEVKSGDWAIGGKVLTTADVKALAAARLQSAPSSAGRTTADVARVGT